MLFPNPADTNLALLIDNTGRQAQFFGTKNAQGLPTAVTGAVIDSEDRDPQKRAVITYDQNARPTLVTLSDGSSMQLAYGSNSQINLTINAGTGQSTALRYDPATGVISPQSPVALTGKKALQPSQSCCGSESSAKTSPQSTSIIPQAAPAGAVEGRILVRCNGRPFNGAFVAASYIPGRVPPGVPSGTRLGIEVRPLIPTVGEYRYSVPKQPFANAPTAADFLSRFADTIENPCASAGDAGFDAGKIEEFARQLGALDPRLGAAARTIGLAIAAACKYKDFLKLPQLTGRLVDLVESIGDTGRVEAFASYGSAEQTASGTVRPNSGNAPTLSLNFPASFCSATPTPVPTGTARPTPTATPRATATARPTATSRPTPTAAPTATPRPIVPVTFTGAEITMQIDGVGGSFRPSLSGVTLNLERGKTYRFTLTTDRADYPPGSEIGVNVYVGAFVFENVNQVTLPFTPGQRTYRGSFVAVPKVQG